MSPLYRVSITTACAALLIAAAGCGREAEESSAPAARDRVVTVETVPVEMRQWQLIARAVGSLTAEEQVAIRNEVGGLVRAIEAAEGDWVEEGALLLRIDDEVAALEVRRAEARYEEMQANLERRRPLFESNLISESEIIASESNFKAAEAELGLARRRLADTAIRAPIEGSLGRRYISRGDYAAVGTRLFDLVQINPLKLDFELPERYLSLVQTGQTVRVRTAAWPELEFEGEIYFIDPLINLATRTIPVRARVANDELQLRPNLFVTVEVDVALLDEALVVPEEAIISDLGGYRVYVVDADDRAQVRAVELGEREPGWIQVRNGVEPGERVVAVGHQRLQPGIRVVDRSQTED